MGPGERLTRRSAAEDLLDTGIFDAGFYAAGSGRGFESEEDAASHFLSVGLGAMVSPHPLIHVPQLPRVLKDAWRAGDIDGVLEHLRGDPSTLAPLGPLFHPKLLPPSEANESPHPGGCLGAFLERAGEDTLLPAPGRTARWGEVRDATAAYVSEFRSRAKQPGPDPAVDWDALRERSGTAVPGRVSVVVPTFQDHVMTAAAVDSVLRSPGDLEVVVVDSGSGFRIGAVLAQLWAGDRRVRVLHLPRNLDVGDGSDLGVAAATGEFVFFLDNDTRALAAGLDRLVARLDDPHCLGVQPLLLSADNSIHSAGTVFLAENHLPVHFLAGMPPEDGQVVGTLRFSAVTAAALLMRRADVLRLRGFEPGFVNGMQDVDLCLRAAEAAPGGYFAVEPEVRFQHLESQTPARTEHVDDNRRLFMERWWGRLPPLDHDKLAAANLRVDRFATDGRLVPFLRPVLVRARPAPPLRWGLRFASTGSPHGDRWGDTSYAESLAAALRRTGQQVVTYRHGANTDTTHVFDDVNLVLRGLDRVPPIPGLVNVLWVISHPELLSPEEVRGYDVVFAASTSWSEQFSREAGREIRPLLQATDAERFLPGEPGSPVTRPTLFVGGHYTRRERQVVRDAVDAGVDLRVIGGGWDGSLPPTMVEADYIDNRDLSAAYRSAARVLADHWTEMAELGFIQNRLFDAVASGARVVSDDVVGLREVFGSAVQTYSSLDDLRHLCSPEGAARFGTDEEILEQAEEVRAQHSFDARARTLVEAVESLRQAT